MIAAAFVILQRDVSFISSHLSRFTPFIVMRKANVVSAINTGIIIKGNILFANDGLRIKVKLLVR